jgi:hypothetical protein
MDRAIPIDEDVIESARAVAEKEHRDLGAIVSEWARRGMQGPLRTIQSRNGFPGLPKRGVTVTLEMVNRLRDEE